MQNDQRVAEFPRDDALPTLWGVPKGHALYAEVRSEYDETDLASARFLVPKPRRSLAQVADLTLDGFVEVEPHVFDAHNFRPGFKIGMVDWAWIAVSGEVRRKLEASGLKRLLLRDLRIEGRPGEHPPEGTCELTSDLVLPPMSASCAFLDNKGRPFDGDYRKGFGLRPHCEDEVECF